MAGVGVSRSPRGPDSAQGIRPAALARRAGGAAILWRWFRNSSGLVCGDLAKVSKLRGGGQPEHLIVHLSPVRIRKCLDVLGHLLRDLFVRSVGTKLPKHPQKNSCRSAITLLSRSHAPSPSPTPRSPESPTPDRWHARPLRARKTRCLRRDHFASQYRPCPAPVRILFESRPLFQRHPGATN